jgi:hypothetical protein
VGVGDCGPVAVMLQLLVPFRNAASSALAIKELAPPLVGVPVMAPVAGF